MPALSFRCAALITCFALTGAMVPFSEAAAADIALNLKTANSLTPDQIEEINTWVAHTINQLKSGLPEDVSIARERLIKELHAPGTSSAYQSALAKAVLPGAEPLLKSPNLLVRLNTTMVMAQVNSVDAAVLLTPSITDKAEGVRFWACRAISTVVEPSAGEHRNLGDVREKDLLKSLSAQANAETSDAVFGEMVDLMATLNTPASQDALLTTLNGHLKALAADPERSCAVAGNGINALYRRFLQSGEKGLLMTRLMACAAHYQQLACRQLVKDPRNSRMIADRYDLLVTCDKLLRAQYPLMGGTKTPPPSATSHLSLKHWKEVLGLADQWEALLKEPPFSVKD